MIKGEVNTLHVRCIASELTGACRASAFRNNALAMQRRE